MYCLDRHLTSESPAMTYEEYKKLNDEVAKDYVDILNELTQ